MALYTSSFCYNIVSGISSSLEDAKYEIKKNFEQMDLENASVEEEMREMIEEMIAEIDQLLATIQSVHFR
ncbi:hypothetical protein [Metabacillus litoralis]|uniref:hypothetical protein n=1 Tax=Metabacillus litoralis TaxID=152268 RepID=UPI000EF5EC1A|nr:hypothetical protein [Metabacillus litoralis]MCM3410040.1 hypothetical protein [Metabacillus litoralis]